MLVSFMVSATMSGDKVEEYIWSGNVSMEASFQLLAKVLTLEAEKKAKEEKKE